MTIPDKPLDIEFDANELTLDDWALFDPEDQGISTPNRLRKFLIAYSKSWTREEIGKIKTKEMEEVAKQVIAAVEKVAVPLASSPSSSPGPE